jgi:hypothetical protein
MTQLVGRTPRKEAAMRLLIPLLIVSTSALAATTVQYAHRAGTERERADAAVALSQKQEAHIRELQASSSAMDQQLMEAQRPAMLPPASDFDRAATGRTAPRPGLSRIATLTRVGPLVAGSYSVSGSRGSVSPWMSSATSPSSPAAQRYMRWQTKTMMRRQYEDLGPALGLTEEQSGKVLDLLTDQMTRTMAEPRNALNDMNSMMKLAAERQARNNAELAALIGENRLPLWQDYQNTMPQRLQVSNVREQMQTLGVPLTEDQRGQLLNIFLEENDRNPYPQATDGASPEEQIAQSMKWQDESDRVFLERAKSVLTREQYERYRDYQAYESEMRNMFRNFRPAMPVNAQISDTVSSVLFRSDADRVPPK